MFFNLFFILNKLSLLCLLVCFSFKTFSIWPNWLQALHLMIRLNKQILVWLFFLLTIGAGQKLFQTSSFLVAFFLLKKWFFSKTFVTLGFAFCVYQKGPAMSSSFPKDLLYMFSGLQSINKLWNWYEKRIIRTANRGAGTEQRGSDSMKGKEGHHKALLP